MSHKVVTTHIQHLLMQAERLAQNAEVWPDLTEEQQVEGSKYNRREGRCTQEELLERAANLAEHAAAELRDELWQSRGYV